MPQEKILQYLIGAAQLKDRQREERDGMHRLNNLVLLVALLSNLIFHYRNKWAAAYLFKSCVSHNQLKTNKPKCSHGVNNSVDDLCLLKNQ